MRPLVLCGSDPARAVTLAVPVLLAPMDGYTDREFRESVLDLGSAGGACTEFVRISEAPVPAKVFRRELAAGTGLRNAETHAAGSKVPGMSRRVSAFLNPVPVVPVVPVGVQLMAPDAEFVPETVAHAESAGAVWIDLNFGCPVKRVFHKCAGSALLGFPDRLGAIVAAAVGATGLPVTAKIRAGVGDASLLDDVLDAAADAGAAAVTLHARLRVNSYSDPARWEWIAHAADRLHRRASPVPLIGNGGVDSAADVARMLRETSCDGVMIGRGALANPWIFREVLGGPPASHAEVLDFARRYLDVVCPPGGPSGPLARYKAFLATIRAGSLFGGDDTARRALLREHDPERIRAWLGGQG